MADVLSEILELAKQAHALAVMEVAMTAISTKKVENHMHAVALHFAHYNFCRVHQTLRVTPAMEIGIADHVWSIEELCRLVPELVAKPRGTYRPRANSK